MQTPENTIVAKQFIHSCHLKGKGSFGSAVVVKEKVKYSDGSVKPNLVVYENPQRNFYITQKKYQHFYKYKPEFELLSRLDKYTCADHELPQRIAAIFNLQSAHGYVERSALFKSPYIFGADIGIEALIKMRYMDLYPDSLMEPTVGFLDIETSIDTGQIILISYTYENIVHTAVLESFLFEEKEGNRVAVKKDDLIKFVKENLASRTKDLDLFYDIEILDSEIKVIAWIMKKVHESEMDFISIWNMNFDIPKILESIKRNKYNAVDFFASPKLARNQRYVRYYEDQRPVQHFTLKWHWLYSTCGSQFVDSMGLYSQCRKTAGFLPKYDLNSILDDQVGLTKLPLTSGSHVIMQRHHFKEYVAYNIFDVVGLRLLEDKNKDFLTMSVLVGPTPVSKFSAQTYRSTNAMYHNLIGKGMVLSSCSGDDDFIKFDKLFPNVGGTVLPPDRVRGVGIELSL